MVRQRCEAWPPFPATVTRMRSAPASNVPARLLFSGLTPQYPGVYQLNIGVPQGPVGDAIPLQVQIGGLTSPPTATIAVAAL